MENFKRAPVWRVSRGRLYEEFHEGACMESFMGASVRIWLGATRA